MIDLSQPEWKELTNRFSSVIINESIDENTTQLTLMSGRVVYGVIKDGTFVIKEASELLLG